MAPPRKPEDVDVPVVLVGVRDPFGQRANGLVQEGHAWIPGMTPGANSMLVGSVPSGALAPEGIARISRREVEVTAGKITEARIDLQRAK